MGTVNGTVTVTDVPVDRDIGNLASDRIVLEDFGCDGSGSGGDKNAITQALSWSAQKSRPVCADRRYGLEDQLVWPSGAHLIASPTARFIRKFSTADGSYMVTTSGGGNDVGVVDIRIQGGVWGPEPLTTGQKRSVTSVNVTFAPIAPTPPATAAVEGTMQFTGADTFMFDDIVHAFKPNTVNANQNRSFKVLQVVSPNTLRVEPAPAANTITNMDLYTTVHGGGGFKLCSTRGVMEGVTMLNVRGIQLLIAGDDFELARVNSRFTMNPDGSFDVRPNGGGLRLRHGRRLRARFMDLVTSDDCYQFNAAGPLDPEPLMGPNGPTNGVLDGASITDSVGWTDQGALVAYLAGGDKPETTAQHGQVINAYARNIRGVVGGDTGYGGAGIKMHCGNSDVPLENCWAHDIRVRQATTQTDTAAVKVNAGRGGLVNCGVRGLVIEDRRGPALWIEQVSAAGFNTPSTDVDFTFEKVRASGLGATGVWDKPLILVGSAKSLTVRDVQAELSDGKSADGVSPGRALVLAEGAAEAIERAVIEDFAVTNARRPVGAGNTDGLWRLGNLGELRAARWRITRAAGLSAATKIGGIEMVGTGAGPTYSVFWGLDFTGIDVPVTAWRNGAGNAIAASKGFDDEKVMVNLAGGATLTINPPSYASIVRVTTDASTSSTVVTMTAPPTGTPRRTLLLGGNVTVASGGNLIMGQSLTGANKSLTLLWRADAANGAGRWQEVARYG